MTFKTKFDIGQYVWVVDCYSLSKSRPCSVCNGTKGIQLKGRTYKCPECHGTGEFYYSEPKAYRIAYKSQVGKIEIEQYSNSYKETYMLKATGITGGTLWDVNDLFGSKKEAEEFCTKMNSQLGVDLSQITTDLTVE